MVSNKLLAVMRSYGVPILAVGDHGQLKPVDKDSGTLMLSPDIKLETIHRQAEGNPIIALSKHVRETGEINARLCDDHHIMMIKQRDFPSFLRRSFVPGRSDLISIAIISWTNRKRIWINQQVREILSLPAERPCVGDIVICLKNKPPACNGMRGIILNDIEENEEKYHTSVDFVEDGFVQDVAMCVAQFHEKKFDDSRAHEMGVSLASLGDLYDYGYALTCHKMQGSQVEKVAVVLEGVHTMSVEDRTRWIYTAVTRSSDRLVIVR
jgi:exodeoxyribonuclease-5